MNMDILQLPEIETKEIIEENFCYHIKAKITVEKTYCNKCFSNNLIHNGTRTILYRDTPIHGKPVGIYLNFQRYLCKNCSNTLYQQSQLLDTDHLMTKRLVEYIYTKAYQYTFAKLALEIGVDEKTIRNVFANNVDRQLKRLDIITPRVLGIDEVHLIGSPRCVITNIEQATIIDVLKTRNKKMLMNYFSQMKNTENIKFVTMDMWRPYYDVISATIPRAKIIIDKFHVVRMASDAMERVRKDIRHGLTNKEQLQLKNGRFLLLKRNYQLNPMEQLALESWRKQYPLLGQAYNLKESFYNIWNHTTKKDAELAYADWYKSIPIELVDYFIPMVNSIDHWHKPIFNYFSNRFTNATTEALNGLIKIMYRDGRGYSFDVLRAKILLNYGTHIIEKARKFNRLGDDKFMMDALPDLDKDYGSSIQKLIRVFESETTLSTK